VILVKVSEAKRLSPWEEGALTLIDLAEDDGFLVASGGKFRLCLPLHLKNDLAKCLGQRISILRTDCDYRFRILDQQS
jgi:hypothetical protein